MQNDRYEIVKFDFEENRIRVIQINGEPWFVLKDLCQALEIVNYREVPDRLDSDEVSLITLPHPQSDEKRSKCGVWMNQAYMLLFSEATNR